jgi:hypothetical protein
MLDTHLTAAPTSRYVNTDAVFRSASLSFHNSVSFPTSGFSKSWFNATKVPRWKARRILATDVMPSILASMGD